MKATVKPECVGQTHAVHGVLVAGVVYEVESVHPRGPFVEYHEPKPPKRAEKE
jgi:hypothetical protein